MDDKELKELLKIDIPEIKGDAEKVLAECKTRKNKYNKQVMKLAYFLFSFVVLVIAAILSIVILNNRTPIDVTRINDSIANLDNIDNNEEKMLRIMAIEKDIQTITTDKQKKINISKLSYETTTTVNKLQQSVEWNEYFTFKNQYCIVESVDGLQDVSMAKVVINALDASNAYEERIIDNAFNDNFFKLIDIPYSEITDLDISELINMFREHTTENDTRTSFYVTYGSAEDTIIEFMIHPSGYIVISVRRLIEDELTMYKKYVSIVRVSYNEFEKFLNKENLKKYNLYMDYSIELHILNNENLDIDSIAFLSISESSFSSTIKLIEDKEDINSIISLISSTNALYAKERYYVSAYNLSCITIGIAIKSDDGYNNGITCNISNEGIFSIKMHNDPYIYYTDKHIIDYNELLLCIKEIANN